MPTLKLFDHNGRPQKEDDWHRFDSLLADIIQNAVVHHETEDSDDEINSFMQQMQWQQLLPGIACITLQDDQLLNDSDFRDILGSAIQECISKKITNGRLARESLSRHCAKSAANLCRSQTAFSIITKASYPIEHWPDSLTYNDATLTVRPKNYSLPALPATLTLPQYFLHRKSWEQCNVPIVEITCNTFSVGQAIDIANRILDITNGLTTLHLLENSYRVTLMGHPGGPTSPILNGPIFLASCDNLSTFIDEVWGFAQHIDSRQPKIPQGRAATSFSRVKEDLSKHLTL